MNMIMVSTAICRSIIILEASLYMPFFSMFRAPKEAV